MSEIVAKQASRRRQPAANPTLSRGEIARVALELGSQEGFDQLSMRSLARVLGVTPMALYHHVADKQDLFGMLVDQVLEDVEVPPLEFGTWQERISELQAQSADYSARYPGIDTLIYQVKTTPQGLRLMNGYIQILREGGFSEQEAVLGFSLIYTMGLGSSIIDRQFGPQSDRKDASGKTERPSNIAREWRRLIKAGGKDKTLRFRQKVVFAGLESIKGTLGDEERA
ncbi:MAG: TetR/AcrR family transcriptional regulator [Candidatus Nanopelagicales bacterium]